MGMQIALWSDPLLVPIEVLPILFQLPESPLATNPRPYSVAGELQSKRPLDDGDFPAESYSPHPDHVTRLTCGTHQTF